MNGRIARAALITGASRGLGLALARGLAERGWTLIIDARGALLDEIPLGTAGVIDAVLPPLARPTLFARFGNMIPLLLALALLIAAIALSRAERYRRDT